MDALAQFARQFALLFNRRKDRRTALIKSAQADEFIGDNADLLIIQRTSHLLAVTSNERNGIAIIQQVDHSGYLRCFNVQLGRDLFGVSHGSDFIMWKRRWL